MQKSSSILLWALLLTSCSPLNAQDAKPEHKERKWFLGSTLYLFGNLDKTNNPAFIQLNAGYRITKQDVIQVRFKKSRYAWPLGIPFGPDFDKKGLNYPGHARILAPQIGYQHFWWKGLHSSVYILNAFEKYMDEEKKKIGNGFTLYTDFYLGYQFKFFKGRLFFEPAIGVSYWPLRKGVPESFKTVEQKWPNYFIQPGFDFGINF
jgi:hypothetical protein